jgi:hypothetical protein
MLREKFRLQRFKETLLSRTRRGLEGDGSDTNGTVTDHESTACQLDALVTSTDCQGPRKHSSAAQRRGFSIQISFQATARLPCRKMNRMVRCPTNGGRQETEMILALLRSEQEEHVGAYSEWCMRVIHKDTSSAMESKDSEMLEALNQTN